MKNIILFGYFLILSVFILLAGCERVSTAEKANWAVDELTRELELTDSQSDQLLTLKRELLRVDSKLSEDQSFPLQELFAEESLDPTEALTMIDSRLENYRTMAVNILGPMAEFYNSLDKEQKSKFRDIVNSHKSRSHARGIFGRERFHARIQ